MAARRGRVVETQEQFNEAFRRDQPTVGALAGLMEGEWFDGWKGCRAESEDRAHW